MFTIMRSFSATKCLETSFLLLKIGESIFEGPKLAIFVSMESTKSNIKSPHIFYLYFCNQDFRVFKSLSVTIPEKGVKISDKMPISLKAHFNMAG
ncbi:MAG: hypothetical protein KIIPBIDF_01812 [Candidatus Methanoperedenaceae archaeon GB50]|nr:MAG: hypothetical protein KIIPBIDF_01812 [Candidatus Methanoperedenaceae archaeon GB50]